MAVYKILSSYYESGKKSIEAVTDSFLKRHKFTPRDRGLIFEIVYGVIRNKAYLDFVVTGYINNEDFIKNKNLILILNIGAYQILFLNKIPTHAAVNESVNMSKKIPEAMRRSGVINAILRNLSRDGKNAGRIPADMDLVPKLALEYSHPEWMVKKWLDDFGLANVKKLLKFNNSRPDTMIRRAVYGNSDAVFTAQNRKILESTRGTGFNNLYYRLKKNIIPSEIEIIRTGAATVQAESSGWVVAMLDPRKGDIVLDVCSAPGGKSSLISELVGREGRVISSDIDFFRLKKVRDTVYRMNLSNLYPFVSDGRISALNIKFDKIILDAPCTGSGVMNHHPDAKWNRKPRDLKRAVKQQRALLNEVASMLSVGGVLVYSTCSVEKEENELQIDKFLELNSNFSLGTLPAELKTNQKSSDGRFLSITPFKNGCDGIFGARLLKISE